MNDDEGWLDVTGTKRYGTWPGGLCCALTVDPDGRLRPEMLPLEVWTLEGEHLIFHEYRADRDQGETDPTAILMGQRGALPTRFCMARLGDENTHAGHV